MEGGDATRPSRPITPAASVAMSAEERAAIRHASAEDARRSRLRQGLPERIEDPAAVAMLAAVLRDIPAPRPPFESISHE
jgi:plasmid stability protein